MGKKGSFKPPAKLMIDAEMAKHFLDPSAEEHQELVVDVIKVALHIGGRPPWRLLHPATVTYVKKSTDEYRKRPMIGDETLLFERVYRGKTGWIVVLTPRPDSHLIGEDVKHIELGEEQALKLLSKFAEFITSALAARFDATDVPVETATEAAIAAAEVYKGREDYGIW